MSLTVSYKGVPVAQLKQSGSLTLNTAGAYCESDIGLAHEGYGTISVTLGGAPVTTVASGEKKLLKTADKTLSGDLCFTIVHPATFMPSGASSLITADSRRFLSYISD